MTKRKQTFSAIGIFAILGALALFTLPFNVFSTTTTPALYGTNVPVADSTANNVSNDVIGNKTDAAAAGAVSSTESIMAYIKQVVGGVIASDTVVDAILVDTGTTIPATISTAQADLDILTGATGANLLTATQASIDAIEVDTETTLPATLAIISAAAGPSYSHPNYLAVATGTFDTSGTWSTVAAHEIAVVTGAVRMTIIAECVTTVSSVSDTGTISLGDEVDVDSVIVDSTLGAGAMASGELWVDATLTRTILTRTQLNAVEFAVAGGQDIGYTVGTNAISGGSMIFHIYWTALDATGAVTAGEGGVF